MLPYGRVEEIKQNLCKGKGCKHRFAQYMCEESALLHSHDHQWFVKKSALDCTTLSGHEDLHSSCSLSNSVGGSCDGCHVASRSRFGMRPNIFANVKPLT